MATTTWTGGTSGAWGTSGNWSNGVPAANDTVIIPKTASNDITSGLDRTGDTAGAGLDLAEFRWVDGSTVNIGTSSAYLQLTAVKMMLRGAGKMYYQCDVGSATNDTDRMIINSTTNLVDAVTLRSNASGLEYITSLEVVAGGVVVNNSSADVVATTCTIQPIVDTDVNLSVGSLQSYLASTVYAKGGSGTFRGGGNVHIFGGDWRHPTGSTLSQHEFRVYGGIFRPQPTAAATSPTGDPVLWMLGGITDFTYDTTDGQRWGTIYWDRRNAGVIESDGFINESIFTTGGDGLGLVKLGE